MNNYLNLEEFSKEMQEIVMLINTFKKLIHQIEFNYIQYMHTRNKTYKHDFKKFANSLDAVYMQILVDPWVNLDKEINKQIKACIISAFDYIKKVKL